MAGREVCNKLYKSGGICGESCAEGVKIADAQVGSSRVPGI